MSHEDNDDFLKIENLKIDGEVRLRDEWDGVTMAETYEGGWRIPENTSAWQFAKWAAQLLWRKLWKR